MAEARDVQRDAFELLIAALGRRPTGQDQQPSGRGGAGEERAAGKRGRTSAHVNTSQMGF